MEFYNIRLFQNESGGVFVAGPDRDGTVDVMSGGTLPTLLQQGQIRKLLEEIGDFPPCMAFSLRALAGAAVEVSVCATVTGDPIIFNARPGRALNELCVTGEGVVAMVVPAPGSYTTYGEAARLAPLMMTIAREELPESLQRRIAPEGVSQKLWNELEELADADPRQHGVRAVHGKRKMVAE